MNKRKSMTIILVFIFIGIATFTKISVGNYINKIKKELTTANEQILELKKINSNQNKEIDSLTDELEIFKKENIGLESMNNELIKKVESLNKKVEELTKKENPLRITKGNTNNTKKNGTPVNITMTFYGDFSSENGGYAGIDASGNKLVFGTVASNYYPRGTQFEYNGQVFTVTDKGGSKLNSPNYLDIFIPRNKNESNEEYRKRLLEYGVRKVVMYKR